MDEDIQRIYGTISRRSIPVSPLSFSNFSPSRTFERDPYYSNLEQSVLSELGNLFPEEKKKLPEYKNNSVQNISVEDAIKELIELESKLM